MSALSDRIDRLVADAIAGEDVYCELQDVIRDVDALCAPVGVEGMVEAFEEYHRADHRDPAVAPEWEWWQAAWKAAIAQQPSVAPEGEKE